MHRFEAAQHLAREGRSSSYFPPHNQYSTPSPLGNAFNREGTMFHPPQPPNRVYPPGSNPRLTSLLASGPSASSPPSFEESGHSGGYPYRMGFQHHGSHPQTFHNKGGGMMESMGEEYAHKVRSGHLAPPPYGAGSHATVGSMASSFGNMGYGSVGGGANSGGSRYYPYHPQHTHQQQPRSGFLEQLLKNRGVQHSTGYPPYGRSSSSSGMMMGQAPSSSQSSMINQQQFYPQGYRGMSNVGYGAGMMSGGGGGGRMGNYFGQPGNVHHQQYSNWRMGGTHGGYQFHPTPQHSGSGFHHHHHHYPQHPYYQHPRNPPYLPIIRNESNEGGHNTEVDENDQEIGKSEARYRKNHERMNAILDETMANCNPIKVPMERVDSLRHHVRLLTDDLNKHKKDAILVKEVCSKRLQNFKDSTARFHADYKKLCQPIAEEEYNELVDKYYKEMKDRLNQERENEGVVPTGGNAASEEVVMEGIGDIMEGSLNKDEKQNDPPLSPSNCSTAKRALPQELGTERNLEDDVIPPQDEDYFDHPLFIDIPPEENESMRAGLTAPPQQPPQQQQQQNQLYQQNQSIPGLFPSPPVMHDGGSGNDLYFGNHQLQPPQDHMEYSYYSPGGSVGFSGTGMGNLLMPVQGQHPPPPPLQQAPFLRGHHSYQNQQYAPGAYHPYHQQQLQSSTRGHGQHYHPHQLIPPPLVSPQIKRTRPSEELREFLLGLVRGKYREETGLSTPPQMLQQVPQLQQQQQGGPAPSTATSETTETQDSSLQPRRFMMSGGGIVEMKNSPPQQTPPPEEQPALYEDAATREWINSLTTDAPTAEPNIVVSAEEGEEDPSQDDNNNLQMDLNSEFMDNSSSGHSTTGKTSKIAEILESPCLNDNIVEEFESDLRQLEVALHGHPVDDLPLQHDEEAEQDQDHQEGLDININEEDGNEENVTE